jgi:hypothetical protein
VACGEPSASLPLAAAKYACAAAPTAAIRGAVSVTHDRRAGRVVGGLELDVPVRDPSSSRPFDAFMLQSSPANPEPRARPLGEQIFSGIERRRGRTSFRLPATIGLVACPRAGRCQGRGLVAPAQRMPFARQGQARRATAARPAILLRAGR